jgi:hypothetical protein
MRATIPLTITVLGALILATSAPAGVSVSASATTTGFSATLDGSDQAVSYSSVGLTVSETGQHSGWNLQATSTVYSSGTHSLPADATAITQVAVGSCTGSSCPTNSVGLPVTMPAAGTAPTAVKFFDAAAGTGTGTVTITPTFVTSVPGNSYAGNYQATIIFSAVVGP